MSAQSSVQRCLPLLAAQAREARPGNLREVHDRLTHPRLLVEAADHVRAGEVYTEQCRSGPIRSDDVPVAVDHERRIRLVRAQ
jgi:hypothetical protein